MTDHTDLETRNLETRNLETETLEIKSGGSVGAAFEDFMRAFEAFKESNDERLSEIERRSAADPLIDDKLARLDRALDETKRVADRLAVKAQRPHLGGEGPIETAAIRDHRRAFDDYVRKGETAAVNHGVGTAIRILQEAVHAGVDGEIGPETRAAIAAMPLAEALDRYAAIRERRYRALPHFWRFGRGWLRRVAATAALARRIAGETPDQPQGDTSMTTTSADETTAKWWGHSITIWGSIITVLSTVLPALAPVTGVDISGDLVQSAGEQVVEAIQAVGALVGTLLTVYGRVRATQPIAKSLFKSQG